MPWTERGSIQGPEGPEGPQGIQGEPGADGGTTPHAARHAVGGDDPVSPASIGASDTAHTHDGRYYTETESDALLGGKANSSHTHAAGDVASGTLAIARIPTGTTSTTVSLGNHTHSYIASSAAGAASGVATLDSGTRVPTAQMPRTPTTRRTVTYAGTVSLDPTTDGNICDITATGDITSLGASTTGVTDGQVLRVRVLASGATRAVTIASAIRTSTNLTRGAYSVPSGQVLICAFEYVGLVSAYVLTAATISAT